MRLACCHACASLVHVCACLRHHHRLHCPIVCPAPCLACTAGKAILPMLSSMVKPKMPRTWFIVTHLRPGRAGRAGRGGVELAEGRVGTGGVELAEGRVRAGEVELAHNGMRGCLTLPCTLGQLVSPLRSSRASCMAHTAVGMTAWPNTQNMGCRAHRWMRAMLR